MVIIAAVLSTVAYLRVRPPPGATLLTADALGLALFALSGAQVAEAARCPPLIVVVMGTMTGVNGGVLRDVLTAQVPLILRRAIYATAAVAGIAVYLALRALDASPTASIGAGMIVVVALRLVLYALLASSLAERLKGNPRFQTGGRYFAGLVYVGLGITTALTGSRK